MRQTTVRSHPTTPRAAEARRREDMVDRAIDACADLVRSQHRLAGQLHAAGLITDRDAAALLAGTDQIDAALADLRNHDRGTRTRRR